MLKEQCLEPCFHFFLYNNNLKQCKTFGSFTEMFKNLAMLLNNPDCRTIKVPTFGSIRV